MEGMVEHTKKSEAATKIQRNFRRHAARKFMEYRRSQRAAQEKLSNRENSAASIQAAYRGYRQRVNFHKEKEWHAAQKIAAAWIGYESRSVLHWLLRDRERLSHDARANEASSVIGAAWRGKRARDQIAEIKAEAHRFKAATLIEASWRGHMSRRSKQNSKKLDADLEEVEAQEKSFGRRMIAPHVKVYCLRYSRRCNDAAFNSIAERQEKAAAALQLQEFARCISARKSTNAKRKDMQRRQQDLVHSEAAFVLQRFCHALRAQREGRRRAALRVAEYLTCARREAATHIQAQYRRRHAKRKVALHRSARLFSREQFDEIEIMLERTVATLILQSAARMWAAEIEVLEMLEARSKAEELREMIEAACTIQRRIRGILARAFAKKERDRRALAIAVAPHGKGYLARKHLGHFKLQTISAKQIQRVARYWLAQRTFHRREMARIAKLRSTRSTQASIIIQKHWKRHVAQFDVHRQRDEFICFTYAAKMIQREARRFIAVVQLRRLRLEWDNSQYNLLLTRSAIIIQCNVRMYFAVLKRKRLIREKSNAAKLVSYVAAGYMVRKELFAECTQRRKVSAAATIQVAWRTHRALLSAKKKAVQRRRILERNRQRQKAAEKIQAAYHGFSTRSRYHKMLELRTRAASRIQMRVRCFLAKKMLRSLRTACRLSRSARRIQQTWFENRRKMLVKREARELEDKLLQINHRALHRSEAFYRRRIVEEEVNESVDMVKEFRKEREWISDAEERILAEWAARSPANLQEESATYIQSKFRGFAVRRRAETAAACAVKTRQEIKGIAAGVHRCFGPSLAGAADKVYPKTLRRKMCPNRQVDKIVERERNARNHIVDVEAAARFQLGGVMELKACPPIRSVLPPIRRPSAARFPPMEGLMSAIVDLSRRGLTENLLRPILHDLRCSTTMEALILDGNPFRDSTCVDLADLLRHNSSIKLLSLCHTMISDLGITHIVASLKHNKTLQCIDVSDTCVTEPYRLQLVLMLSCRTHPAAAATSHVQKTSNREEAMRSISPSQSTL